MKRVRHSKSFFAKLCSFILLWMFGVGLHLHTSSAQEAETSGRGTLELYLKESAQVASNLVRLSDLVDARHCKGINSRQLDLVLAPSPSQQNEQEWTRSSIASLLSLKGISATSIQWSGNLACQVRRSQKIVSTASESPTPDSGVVTASATVPTTHAFEPAKVVSKSNSISERNAISVIQDYLRTKSNSDFDYEVAVDIPAEGNSFLKNRSDIVGITGGQSPWLGNQRFVLQTKNGSDLTVVEIAAKIEMPPLVFATVRSLPRDHILSEADFKLVVLPKSSRVQPSMCFVAPEELVGKQLNRTLATGQPIESSQVGSPRLISQNDDVEVQVSAPGLMVSQNARALQGGGLNDLIIVELQPQRTKLTARVVAAGVVSVISN